MARTVQEWIGKDDDAVPPPRVRLRIFQAHGGRCYRTGRLIRPGDAWALDHIIALCNGGENRETNLGPMLVESHKEKTAQDRAEKRKTDAMTRAAFGIDRPKGAIKSRGFAKTSTKRREHPMPMPEPKPMFVEDM